MRLCFSLFLLLFLMSSCSDGLKDDAIRSHELMLKSEEAIKEYDFESADKYFQEYKEIENKYLNTDKYEAFEKAYWENVTKAKN